MQAIRSKPFGPDWKDRLDLSVRRVPELYERADDNREHPRTRARYARRLRSWARPRSSVFLPIRAFRPLAQPVSSLSPWPCVASGWEIEVRHALLPFDRGTPTGVRRPQRILNL